MPVLSRRLAVGEKLSFDDGRIVLSLEARSGRRATIRMVIDESLKVDKPIKEDAPQIDSAPPLQTEKLAVG